MDIFVVDQKKTRQTREKRKENNKIQITATGRPVSVAQLINAHKYKTKTQIRKEKL